MNLLAGRLSTAPHRNSMGQLAAARPWWLANARHTRRVSSTLRPCVCWASSSASKVRNNPKFTAPKRDFSRTLTVHVKHRVFLHQQPACRHAKIPAAFFLFPTCLGPGVYACCHGRSSASRISSMPAVLPTGSLRDLRARQYAAVSHAWRQAQAHTHACACTPLVCRP